MIYSTEPRVCEYCGEAYYPKAANQRFCNLKCKDKHYQNIKPDKRVDKFGELTEMLREEGISYAEWQKQKTLRLAGRVEV